MKENLSKLFKLACYTAVMLVFICLFAFLITVYAKSNIPSYDTIIESSAIDNEELEDTESLELEELSELERSLIIKNIELKKALQESEREKEKLLNDYDTLSLYVEDLNEEIERLKPIAQETLDRKDAIEAHLAKCRKEYPIKTAVYEYLKAAGYSDYVACGIIGNMMKECGMNNDLRPFIHSSNYYGLCQWSKKYHPEIVKLFADYDAKKINDEECLLGQLEYLVKTIPNTVNDSWGTLSTGKQGWKFYKAAKMTKGFTYKDFFNLSGNNISEVAAYCFAATYERPSNTNYSLRALEAFRAYEYFVINY